MGMFDSLICRYKLPLDGANDLDYQTKDTPRQFMDLYEIREDGTLWVDDYDIEDRSDRSKWEAAHPGEEVPEELKGLLGLAGCATRVNRRWKQEPYNGELRFYTSTGKDHSGWVEWSITFIDGKIKQLPEIRLIENKPPTSLPGSDGIQQQV